VTGHLLLQGRRALASEAERVLRPGGRLFFREFGCDDMRAGLGEEVEPFTFRRGGIITHYFTESEVADLFCGLEVGSVDTHRWKMRVKGRDLVRSQVEVVLVKMRS
jgi:SAM-dependent methyltransferase